MKDKGILISWMSERTEHLLPMMGKAPHFLLRGVGTEWNTSALVQCNSAPGGQLQRGRGLGVNADIHCWFLMVLNQFEEYSYQF